MREVFWVATHDGYKLHAVKEGNSTAPAIVFVHGYPDNHTVWDAMIEQLKEDFCIVRYDVRGAGLSEQPEKTDYYTLNRLSKDLLSVVTACLPNQDFHLVGHDWGSIQMWEPVTDPSFPRKILSYTSLSGPCLDHVSLWMRSSSTANRRQKLKQIGKSWYIGMFHLPLIAPTIWRNVLGHRWGQLMSWTEGSESVHANPTQYTDGIYGINLYRANFINTFSHPRKRHALCPVQLIVLRKDKYVGYDMLAELEQWVPNLTRKTLNLGHWGIVSHPIELADNIKHYIQSNVWKIRTMPPHVNLETAVGRCF